jgi:hypothetical protein
MKSRRVFGALAVLALGATFFTGCPDPNDPGQENDGEWLSSLTNPFFGTWEYHDKGIHKVTTFNADGTFTSTIPGESPGSEAGSYLVRDDILVTLVSDSTNPVKYTFTVKDNNTLELRNDETDIHFTRSGEAVDHLDHPVVLSDKFVGKNWQKGSSGMFDWYAFKNDGTFHKWHAMNRNLHYADYGEFSYLINEDILLTLSQKIPEPDNRSAKPASYTLAVYTLSGNESTASTWTPLEGSAINLSSFNWTFKFNADGTFSANDDTEVRASGSYIARDNVLAILYDKKASKDDYADPASASKAVEKYTFTEAGGRITLTGPNDSTASNTYALSGTIPARNLSNTLSAGHYWRTASWDGMYDWFEFKTDGTFHQWHYMMSNPEYADRGEFSYLYYGTTTPTLITLSSSNTVTVYSLSAVSENSVTTSPLIGPSDGGKVITSFTVTENNWPAPQE